MSVLVILTTMGATQVQTFARAMCESRLVACANIISGVRSLYWWEGELCEDDESIVLMETTDDRVEAAMQRASELHPYDVPKLIALQPTQVADTFARWVADTTRLPSADL